MQEVISLVSQIQVYLISPHDFALVLDGYISAPKFLKEHFVQDPWPVISDHIHDEKIFVLERVDVIQEEKWTLGQVGDGLQMLS